MDSEPTGLAQIIGSAVVALGGGAALLYKAARGVKVDSRHDNTVADLDARLKEERARADNFAKERMQMAADVASMTASLGFLRDQIRELKEERDELLRKVSTIEAEMNHLNSAMDVLIEEAAITKVVLTQSGHVDLLQQIQELVNDRVHALGLAAKCAPAPVSLHDQSTATRRKRLSGNDAPLKAKGE